MDRRLPDPRLEATVGEPQDVGQISAGHRRIVPLTAGTLSGPELRGSLLPAASADWQIILSDGTAVGEVHYTLETERGDLLYVQARSVRHGGLEVFERLGRGEDVEAAGYTFRSSAKVGTGDANLEWLNKGVFTSVGGRYPGDWLCEDHLVG
jgi:Protein of unknown function (DUF3237)